MDDGEYMSNEMSLIGINFNNNQDSSTTTMNGRTPVMLTSFESLDSLGKPKKLRRARLVAKHGASLLKYVEVPQKKRQIIRYPLYG